MPAVGQTDHYLIDIIDHMGVGNDQTSVVKDDAGTVTGIGYRDQHHRVDQRLGYGDHRLVARVVDRRLGEQAGYQRLHLLGSQAGRLFDKASDQELYLFGREPGRLLDHGGGDGRHVVGR